MEPLWKGRISEATDETLYRFNASLAFDSRLIRHDIQGSCAHAQMLCRQGILSQADCDAICAGLRDILADIESGTLAVTGAEDIHSFVETELTARIGDAGKRLHTARSRNDQVALDLRLWMLDETKTILEKLAGLIRTIADLGQKHSMSVMPGYTHLQRGQPLSFGQHILAYAQMFSRDVDRLRDGARRTAISPLGCGALAGTTFDIDRELTAALLGMSGPCENSVDGVSDRDFVVEFLSNLSVVMMHLSRLAEELILWSSWEFKFIEMDDSCSTGSSIMPQKKNPDMAELIRGKTGRVYGNLMGMLTVMKGLPLAYDKDMQEDKQAVFDAADTVEDCLFAANRMLETMTVLPENMAKAARQGFINATDCADYLTAKGMPFRDAYKLTGELVAHCIESGKTLEELTLEELKALSPLFEADYYKAVDLLACMACRRSFGGTAPQSVTAQAAQVIKKLETLGL